jgi:hypothetical protein
VSAAAATPPSRGSSGRAPPPPAWLDAANIPIDVVAAGTPLYRVHRLAHDPMFFGPGAGAAPIYRFDSPSGAFGVLYLGLGLACALVETLLRNPARKMVAYADLAARGFSVARGKRDLRLARLRGTGLQQLGCDNAISTGPYEPCGEWADALWTHKDAPDGIAYHSRHDSSQICLAVFSRPDLGLTAGPSTPLLDQVSTIAKAILYLTYPHTAYRVEPIGEIAMANPFSPQLTFKMNKPRSIMWRPRSGRTARTARTVEA